MAQNPSTVLARWSTRRSFLATLAFLLLLLGFIFHKSFAPEQTLFSNDGPLGAITAQSGELPSGFFGVWLDLNWVGNRGIGASPNWSSLLAWLTGPVLFSKIYPPFALLLLGLCTWLFLRQLGFNWLVCLLGAAASLLNMNVFSTATWGLPNWSLARAMIFLALAALVTRADSRAWLKAALAGLAVGMAVMEGFDMGAIYSLYVAAFVVFQAFNEEAKPGPKLLRGLGRAAIVAGFAAFIAAQSLASLIGTQVKGIAGTQQDDKTKQEQWDWATQWSMPKVETLRVIIPGLFGYRMDTPDGGNYWGSVGRTPGWEEHRQGLARHSGAGEYSGVLVVMLAAWALLQSFRGNASVFQPAQRRFIWFWAGAALISLLLAFGRHAPFYGIIYSLPYFSTIRNPVKFLHPFQLSLLILFAYGLEGLCRQYLSGTAPKSDGFAAFLKKWRQSVAGFDRKWAVGSALFLAASALGWLLFTSSKRELMRYLENAGFDGADAALISQFSAGEIGLFVFFLALSIALVIVILSGWFRGPRVKWAGLLLGGILVLDLVRANLPWVIYYNYQEKYASNPLFDFLRAKPYENRVTVLPFQGIPQLGMLQQIYHALWIQHHFPYYNIQALDVVQEPRKAQEKVAYESAVAQSPLRYWQLTNTRFFFGLPNLVDPLNQQLDPAQRRFRVHTPFTLAQERGDGPILLSTNQGGDFALLEFTGALPRAQLYQHWEVAPDENAALQRLTQPTFDPSQMAVVSGPDIPTPPNSSAPPSASSPATATITRYAPKEIELKTASASASMLLLNDKYDPDWDVWVDGQPGRIVRGNYLMRAVPLPAGNHTVLFRFQPPLTGFYISVSAIILGLALLCLLWRRRFQPSSNSDAEETPALPPTPSPHSKTPLPKVA